MNEIFTLYTDGASRGNPGEAAIGVYCRKGERSVSLADYKSGNKQEAFSLSRRIGIATNNVAEYQALIDGLSECINMKITPVRVCLDSELVVKQINGQYKIKDAKMKEKFLEVLPLLKILNTTIVHVKREQNAIADYLANSAYKQ